MDTFQIKFSQFHQLENPEKPYVGFQILVEAPPAAFCQQRGFPCGSISSLGALGGAWIWIWEFVRRRRRRRLRRLGPSGWAQAGPKWVGPRWAQAGPRWGPKSGFFQTPFFCGFLKNWNRANGGHFQNTIFLRVFEKWDPDIFQKSENPKISCSSHSKKSQIKLNLDSWCRAGRCGPPFIYFMGWMLRFGLFGPLPGSAPMHPSCLSTRGGAIGIPASLFAWLLHTSPCRGARDGAPTRLEDPAAEGKRAQDFWKHWMSNVLKACVKHSGFFFCIFPVHERIGLTWPKMGPGGFFLYTNCDFGLDHVLSFWLLDLCVGTFVP